VKNEVDQVQYFVLVGATNLLLENTEIQLIIDNPVLLDNIFDYIHALLFDSDFVIVHLGHQCFNSLVLNPNNIKSMVLDDLLYHIKTFTRYLYIVIIFYNIQQKLKNITRILNILFAISFIILQNNFLQQLDIGYLSLPVCTVPEIFDYFGRDDSILEYFEAIIIIGYIVFIEYHTFFDRL